MASRCTADIFDKRAKDGISRNGDEFFALVLLVEIDGSQKAGRRTFDVTFYARKLTRDINVWTGFKR